jgi:hypothetical protein
MANAKQAGCVLNRHGGGTFSGIAGTTSRN